MRRLDKCRFSALDKDRIVYAVRRELARGELNSDNLEASGRHAIGCKAVDLRDVELAWIAKRVEHELGRIISTP